MSRDKISFKGHFVILTFQGDEYLNANPSNPPHVIVILPFSLFV